MPLVPPIRDAVIDERGMLTPIWQKFMLALNGQSAGFDSGLTLAAIAFASSSGNGGSTGSQQYFTGTHAARAGYPATSYPNGSLYWESDRHALYVDMLGFWWYVSGIYIDTAANVPADLGGTDIGFLFLASDTNAISRWDGSGFIEINSYTSAGSATGSRLGADGLYFEWQGAEGGDDASVKYDGTRLVLTGSGTDKPVGVAGKLELNNANYAASKVLLTDGSKVVVSDAAGVTASNSYVKGLTFSFGIPDASGLVTLGDVITWAQNLITALGGSGATVVRDASASGTVAATAGLVTTLS